MSEQEKEVQDTHFNQQLQLGLVATYNAMLAFKKYKQSPVIISRNGKVVPVAPEDMPILPTATK